MDKYIVALLLGVLLGAFLIKIGAPWWISLVALGGLLLVVLWLIPLILLGVLLLTDYIKKFKENYQNS